MENRNTFRKHYTTEVSFNYILLNRWSGKDATLFFSSFQVDDELVDLPFKKRGINIYLQGKNVVTCTNFGLRVTSDGRSRATVRVPKKYKNKMCGMCSNFNGNRKDDLKDARGKLQRSHASFGNSWFVRGAEKAYVYIIP